MKKKTKDFFKPKAPKPRKKTIPLETTTGRISTHPKGFGFIQPDSEEYKEIFVPRSHMKGAVDGDIVRVSVSQTNHPKGPEGKIVQIIKRAHQTIAGIVYKKTKKDTFVFLPLFGVEKIAVINTKSKAHYDVGDRLLCKIVSYGGKDRPMLLDPVKKFGTIDDPSIDIDCAKREFDLYDTFDPLSIKQAHGYGDQITQDNFKGRKDLTAMHSMTIDPTTAKDYDDALYVEKSKTGYTLFVHIADVSYYVGQGTPLDKDALEKGNSTYFPGVCVPMLPFELSNELCSLKEKEKRLAVTVEAHFNTDGDLLDSSIYRSVIESKKRLTYEQAFEILQGDAQSPYYNHLTLLKELCLLLKAKRLNRGSVDLAMPEVVLEYDQSGMPNGIKVIDYDITHQMVEECMLQANEIVAKTISAKDGKTLFRVHESPMDHQIDDFLEMAKSYGVEIPMNEKGPNIAQLFLKIQNESYAKTLGSMYIKSMKQAIYSDENIGHFGLNLDHYCHFTSPIRRYSDLVVHRQLFEKMPLEGLSGIAKACSQSERRSFKAEMSALSLKKLRYLKLLHNKEPNKHYKAMITNIKNMMFFFELSEIYIDGMLQLSDLHDDYYHFDEKTLTLTGEQTNRKLKAGTFIQVEIMHVDLILRTCKYAIR